MKKCVKCKKSVPASNFYRSEKWNSNVCKDCKNKYSKKISAVKVFSEDTIKRQLAGLA